MNILNRNKDRYEKSQSKIDEFFSAGVRYSGEASKVARQLAFGEGAIFWFFFKGYEEKLTLLVAIGLSFLVLYFIFDIFQYLIGASRNENLGETYEQLNKADSPLSPDKISRPINMNIPIDFCYYAKFIMLGLASVFLLSLFINFFLFKPC